MSNYSVSQKLVIINEISDESRQLWKMLNDNPEQYDADDIKKLFVNILNVDSEMKTRFSLEACQEYIESSINNSTDKNNPNNPTNFDLLTACYIATRQENLHKFLFDL